MIDIGIYLFDDGHQSIINPNTSLIDGVGYSYIKSVASNNNINISINEIDIHHVPQSCEHDAIMFLSNNTFLAKNYFNQCASILSMMPDFGIVCGPITVLGDKLAKYYGYNLYFHNVLMSNIGDEDHNYPPLNGAIISKQAYNNFLYCPIISNRHTSINNKAFVYAVSKKHPIYYYANLKKLYFAPKNNIDSLLSYYYDYGYQDGNLLRHKSIEEKNKEIWHKFVDSPESIDKEMPRWFSNKSADYTDISTLEQTVLIKCKYQIGFLEGLMNKNLV